ncbi:hypothetical protein N431DRAFT_404105 [Stipitochalara longipes BDJ]|nr:hypothetical protein N431DRAFT_404105 [Stipitochalara longipes BDJ]
MGRKWIQIQEFVVAEILLVLPIAQVCSLFPNLPPTFSYARQSFFNFDPNATTFIIPAEVYPSLVRGSAHGFSVAIGKLSAILSALLSNHLSVATVIRLANVLWTFFACNILGALIMWFLIPETKGRDVDVSDFWSGRRLLARRCRTMNDSFYKAKLAFL